MKIQLNTKGRPGGWKDSTKDKGEGFLRSILGPGNIRHAVNIKMLESGFEMPASPLLQAAFWAFSQHRPLRIEPSYIWVTVIQELATLTKMNPEQFAKVFNGDPANKRTVKVRCDNLLLSDDDWGLAIGLFRAALAEETGASLVEGFFPGFSTDDETRKLAYLVSAMDAASPYFKYEVWSMCGISEIHLEGTVEDWRSLYERIMWLEATFGQNVYFTRVKSIVDKIGRQVHRGQPDKDFWMSMFKYKSESLGDFISGWIADLYAHEYTENGPVFKEGVSRGGYGIDTFPSGLSVVPFIWVRYGTEQTPMRFFAGFTGLDEVDGVLQPLIGYGVIEG